MASVLKFIGHELTRRGPLSPALLKHETDRANSLQSRIADVITGFAGSMTFVYVHVAWFAFWISLSVEKYPYGRESRRIAVVRGVPNLLAMGAAP